jgi:hypothetical protein
VRLLRQRCLFGGSRHPVILVVVVTGSWHYYNWWLGGYDMAHWTFRFLSTALFYLKELEVEFVGVWNKDVFTCAVCDPGTGTLALGLAKSMESIVVRSSPFVLVESTWTLDCVCVCGFFLVC